MKEPVFITLIFRFRGLASADFLPIPAVDALMFLHLEFDIALGTRLLYLPRARGKWGSDRILHILPTLVDKIAVYFRHTLDLLTYLI